MAIRNYLPDLWRGGELRGTNPLREMSRLQRRIDRMFDEFFEPIPLMMRPMESLEGEEAGFIPACDIEESDSQFVVSFDLPGLRKEDVKIDLRENQLVVSGERKQEHKGRGSRERYYGSFVRSFTLPSNIDAEKVQASYDSGVLQIVIPKTQVAAAKQIPIKEGKLLSGKETKPEKAA